MPHEFQSVRRCHVKSMCSHARFEMTSEIYVIFPGKIRDRNNRTRFRGESLPIVQEIAEKERARDRKGESSSRLRFKIDRKGERERVKYRTPVLLIRRTWSRHSFSYKDLGFMYEQCVEMTSEIYVMLPEKHLIGAMSSPCVCMQELRWHLRST